MPWDLSPVNQFLAVRGKTLPGSQADFTYGMPTLTFKPGYNYTVPVADLERCELLNVSFYSPGSARA